MTIQKIIPVFLLLFFLVLVSPIIDEPVSASGDTWFVSENGMGTECSRENPGPLQYCVEQKAQSGDTVYVGEGFYDTDDPTDDNLLLIEKSIHLIGSCTWDTTGPITCEPQNIFPRVSSSRLCGQNKRRVIAVQGPGISVTIENFVIYQGNAEGKEPKIDNVVGAGGGIYADDIDQFIVKNNFIWKNKAEYSGESSGTSFGGGIFTNKIENLIIVENVINFNEASSPFVYGSGGGLCVFGSGDGGVVNISFNQIHGNSGGSASANSRGGGLFLVDIKNLNLDNNVFEDQNNTPPDQFWIKGSAIYFVNVSANSIDRNSFKNNYGESVVEIDGLTGDFSRSQFWDNEASYDIYIYEGDINIINNFFGKWYPSPSPTFSATNSNRGGISTLIYVGGGYPYTPHIGIINNTFALAEYGVQTNCYNVVVKRNIFTGLTKKAIDVTNPAGTIRDIDENLFWMNTDNGRTGSTYWSADPKLVDLDYGDFHIQPGSAAIDKVLGGTIVTDIDGQPRPIGSGIDLGADEYGAFIFMPLILSQ